ncbi:cytochrome c oxidase-assembly factor cox-23, mitochondrial [Elsinoe ampelina]|uniref:Cytochrome c oxidase-assembly factor cox-23, mitochondrial n=1 Tax=Elsinoe ampelina TaxID=302913 RepID=A0A6A6GC50_9PEZI|nr:cytochrome c oxidase-assembly factor cox-23, mitochondrial [Elsinoe ampelina]
MAESEAPQKSEEWEKSGAQFKAKANSQYMDPCQEAANKSLKCLRRNGGSRDMCMDYFDAYRECKKKWQAELAEEKRKQGRWF